MINQLRAILICDSADQASEVEKNLAVAGFAPGIERITDVGSFQSRLSTSHPVDVVLLFLPNALGPPDEILHLVQQTHLPPPVICIGETKPGRVTDCLQLGAADHVDEDNPAHLVRVIEREMNNLAIQRESAKLKASYAELEMRYRQLARDFEQPLAYVHDGIHMFANPAWFELFQLSPEDDLSGVPLMDLLPADQHEQIRPLLKARDPAHPPDPQEITLDDGDTWRLKCAPVTFDGLPCVQVTLSRRQPSEDNEIARHLNHLILFDIASGLFSRTHFIHRLEKQAAAGQAAEGGQQAVILVSLENFDEIASETQLSTADRIYAEAGREIKSLLSVDDLVCRYDQSTFGLLIRCTDQDSLKTFTTRLVDALNTRKFSLDNTPVPCQFAAGYALLTGNNAYDALSRAAVTHGGGDTRPQETLEPATEEEVEVPETDAVPPAGTQADDSREGAIASIDANWAAQIREALKKNRFRLQFKTLFPVNGDNRKRYRVSLKMTTVHNGDIDEEIFLPSARRKGLTAELDQWLMDNLFRELEEQQPNVSRPELFVQLSQDSLFSAQHFHPILQRIQAAPAFQSQLVIEFSLRDLVDHLRASRALIESLRPLGCEFSVKQSREFPDPFPALEFTHPRYLTLDSKLTGRIDDDPETARAIESLARRAHEDDIRVIAVEVQNANQFFQLKDLGIDYAQGPFFHEDANYEYESSVMPG